MNPPAAPAALAVRGLTKTYGAGLTGIVREVLVGLGVMVVARPLVGIGIARPVVLTVAALALLVSGAQLGVLAGTYARSLDDIPFARDARRAAAPVSERDLLLGHQAAARLAGIEP